MSLHDAYARVTPVELIFPDPERAVRLADEIAEEAAGRGADPASLPSFLTMGSVADFMSELAETDGEGLSARYGPAVFHAHHFARAPGTLYLLQASALRYVVGGSPGGSPVPPAPVGYVQLPRHLLWVRGDDGVPASVDGIFWHTLATGALAALVATGVRGDGSGFDVLPLPEAPLADATAWLDVDGRGDGSDFSTDIPGAEIDGLLEVRTAGEVLKLLARFFAYVERVPEAGRSSAPHEGPTDPQPSRIPYVSVSLTA